MRNTTQHKGLDMTRLVFQTVMAVAMAMVAVDVIKSVLPASNPIVKALRGK